MNELNQKVDLEQPPNANSTRKAKTSAKMSIIACSECGCSITDPNDTIMADNEPYCPFCIDEHFATCGHCNEIIRIEEAVSDDYNTFCRDCFDNQYVRCSGCHEIIFRNNAYEQGDSLYCNSCYDDCYDDEDDIYLHDYSYKPTPEFFGTGDRYFGVELEIDEGGKRCDHAERLLAVGNRFADALYIKSDGSLNCGLEIVTHPMTLAYHKETMPWVETLAKARSLGYRSHKTDTCGLHVHVNRSTFGTNEAKQEECISRVLYFVEHHWEELLKFTRRSAEQMKRWANRYGYKNHPQEVLAYAKSGCLGRYACVNITNYDTIEFRMFRGTLKYNTLIAVLQMVNAICDAAIFMSDAQICGLPWSDFVRALDASQYSELITYLKERQLYVNEPVNDIEEDC